jgi:hypothetical protein
MTLPVLAQNYQDAFDQCYIDCDSIEAIINPKTPRHPFLSGSNAAEAALGLVAITAGVATIITTGSMLSAWLSLVFAIGTTIIAALSAYHLWHGN